MNKKWLCVTERKAFAETQNNINLFPSVAFHTTADCKPGGSREKFIQNSGPPPKKSAFMSSKPPDLHLFLPRQEATQKCPRCSPGPSGAALPALLAGCLPRVYPPVHVGTSRRQPINKTGFHPHRQAPRAGASGTGNFVHFVSVPSWLS